MPNRPLQTMTTCQETNQLQALKSKLARLESLQDLYETQLEALDTLLQALGFEHGLMSLKNAAEELLLCQDYE